MLLQLQIDDAPLLVIEAGEQLLKLIGELRGLGRRRTLGDGLERTAPRFGGLDFLVQAAFLAEVEARLFPYLGESDGAQEPPESFAIGQLELADLCAAQKGAAGGLNHVLRPDAPADTPGKVLVGDGVQEVAVLV